MIALPLYAAHIQGNQIKFLAQHKKIYIYPPFNQISCNREKNLKNRLQSSNLKPKVSLTLNKQPHKHIPVDGVISTSWGEKTPRGISQAVLWKTNKRVPVLAPCSGRLLFSGSFQNFGKMIILNCNNNKTFILSGFNIIYKRKYLTITRGMTLGEMPNGQHILFTQLRYNNKAINPMSFFTP